MTTPPNASQTPNVNALDLDNLPQIDRSEIVTRIREIFSKNKIVSDPDEVVLADAAESIGVFHDLLTLAAFARCSDSWTKSDSDKLDEFQRFAMDKIVDCLICVANSGNGKPNYLGFGVTLRNSPQHPIVILTTEDAKTIQEWAI